MESQGTSRLRLVDTREPQHIRDILLMLGWEQKALLSGDYFFLTCHFQKVGISRKTIGDLLSSIGGRLPDSTSRAGKTFGQHLEEMLDWYDLRIILLEGSWEMVKGQIISGRGVEWYTWDMVWNFLRSWQDKGFTLELTSNEGHTIKRLQALYAYYQKPYHTGAIQLSRVGDDRVFAFPSGCRGKVALGILEGRSLQDVANMSGDELLAIPHVGAKRAGNIVQHFRRV